MSSRTPFGVDDQLAIDGVGDVSLEGAQGFSFGLALGDLAIEVGPSARVGLADLAYGHHVDCVVKPTMTAQREPVEYPTPRGVRDRSDTRIGGEAVLVGEATNVAGETDQLAGKDRAHTEQISERGLRCSHGSADPTV
jgi:hypothetical protein